MDSSAFISVPGIAEKCLKVVGDTLITLKPLSIYTPCHYAERDMAVIGKHISVSGVCAWVFEGNKLTYTTIPAMLRITPNDITTATNKSDGLSYYEFIFNAGQVVLPTLMLPKVDTFVYNIYVDLMSRACVPFFLMYDNVGRSFEETPHYAGVNFAEMRDRLELLASLMARSPDDTRMYYRHYVDGDPKRVSRPPQYVSLSNNQHAARGTLALLSGAGFKDGLTTALAHPHERVERMEGILRK